MALAVAVLLFVGVTLDVVLGGPLTTLDVDVLVASRRIDEESPVGRGLALLTQFGAWLPVLAGLVPYVLWVSARARSPRPLGRLAVVGVLLAGSVLAGKIGFGRTHPDVDDSWLLWTPDGRSYPSGHTATAIALWGLAAWVAADFSGARTRALTRVLRWLAPVLTMLGMVALHFHWLTDVLAAAGLGVLVLWVAHLVDRTALAHLPGADRGIAGGGDAARGGVARPVARLGGRPGAVHDPRPADR